MVNVLRKALGFFSYPHSLLFHSLFIPFIILYVIQSCNMFCLYRWDTRVALDFYNIFSCFHIKIDFTVNFLYKWFYFVVVQKSCFVKRYKCKIISIWFYITSSCIVLISQVNQFHHQSVLLINIGLDRELYIN